jgi:hypothetical protein
MVFIYLTHILLCVILFLAVTGLFALFLLPSVRLYARTESGRASATNTHAALTTNHLPKKGDLWLRTILPAYRNPSFTICSIGLTHPSPVFTATWWHWNKSEFSIRSSCRFSIASPNSFGPTRISICSEPCAVSKNVTENDSHKSAIENFSNLNTEPAERRVLSSCVLVVFGISGDSPKFPRRTYCVSEGRRTILIEHVFIFNHPIQNQNLLVPIAITSGLNDVCFRSPARSNRSNDGVGWFDVVKVWFVGKLQRSKFENTLHLGYPGTCFPLVSAFATSIYTGTSIRDLEGLGISCWKRFNHNPSAFTGNEGLRAISSCFRSRFGLPYQLARLLSSSLHFSNGLFSGNAHFSKLFFHPVALNANRNQGTPSYEGGYSRDNDIDQIEPIKRLRDHLYAISPFIRFPLMSILLLCGCWLTHWGAYGSIRRYNWSGLGAMLCFIGGFAILYDWIFRLYGR